MDRSFRCKYLIQIQTKHMLIRFFELLSLNRLEISKMDIAENLI